MHKSYYLKQRAKKVNEKGIIEYADWWKKVEKYILSGKSKKSNEYDIVFEVKKDLSQVDGFEVKDDTQICKLVIALDGKKNKLIFITDADEFMLPSSKTPKGSVTAIGFFMSNTKVVDIISFKSISLKNVNTSNMLSIQNLFNGCTKVKEIDLNNMNTNKVTNMRAMFSQCFKLKKINNMNFNTSKVTTMNRMFWSCTELEELDLSHFDVSEVLDMQLMFDSCKSLKKIGCNNWKLNKNVIRNYVEGEDLISMFFLCSARDAYFPCDELSYNDCFMYGEAPKKDFDKDLEVDYCDYINECYGCALYCNFYNNKDDIETFRGIRINDTIDKIFERYGKQEVLDRKDDLMMNINAQFKRAIKNTNKVIKLSFHYDVIDFTLRFFIGNDNKVKVIGYFFGENRSYLGINEKTNKNTNRKINKKIKGSFYWWYYHLDEEAVAEIEPVLEAKDWKKFKELQKKWNKEFIYLPNDCMVYYENGEVEYNAEMTKEIFEKMTGNEYECG